MAWLNSEFWFDDRRAIIVFDAESRDLHRSLLSMAHEARDNPEAVEDLLRQLLINSRPDLEAACIHYIKFQWATAEWDIGISHPSLDRVARGVECPRIVVTGKEPPHADTEG